MTILPESHQLFRLLANYIMINSSGVYVFTLFCTKKIAIQSTHVCPMEYSILQEFNPLGQSVNSSKGLQVTIYMLYLFRLNVFQGEQTKSAVSDQDLYWILISPIRTTSGPQ